LIVAKKIGQSLLRSPWRWRIERAGKVPGMPITSNFTSEAWKEARQGSGLGDKPSHAKSAAKAGVRIVGITMPQRGRLTFHPVASRVGDLFPLRPAGTVKIRICALG